MGTQLLWVFPLKDWEEMTYRIQTEKDISIRGNVIGKGRHLNS